MAKEKDNRGSFHVQESW